jgi:hypothetical protein
MNIMRDAKLVREIYILRKYGSDRFYGQANAARFPLKLKLRPRA